MSIPRIIHQTWKNHDVPRGLRAFQDEWRRLHGDFEYRLWTDKDNARLVAEHYPQLQELYHALASGIMRADLARYLYLHRFGGVYADLDVEPLVRIDESVWWNRACVIGSEPEVHARSLWGKQRLACNAIMLSEAGHPFWLAVVDELRDRRRRGLVSNPVSATGPIALDAAWKNHGEALDVVVAAPDVFFPLPDLENRKLGLSERQRAHYARMLALGCYPSDCVAVHHWAHTWIPTQTARRNWRRARRAVGQALDVLRGSTTIDEVLRPQRYAAHFPEAAFPPRASTARQYMTRVAAGRERARQLRASLLILIHDRIDLAVLLRARLQALCGLFGESTVYLGCNDSTDGTEMTLADFPLTAPHRVARVDVSRPRVGANGYAKMAGLRNCLLDAAEAANTASDLTVVMDGDLEGPVSLEGIAHSVALLFGPDAPDVVSAFGVNNWGGLPGQIPFVGYSYYDPLAFRERSFSEHRSDASVRLKLSGMRRGDPALRALSAFGGLTIYRTSCLQGLRYDTATSECEHLSLHRRISERGGKLVVNPALLLLAGRQGHHAKG